MSDQVRSGGFRPIFTTPFGLVLRTSSPGIFCPAASRRHGSKRPISLLRPPGCLSAARVIREGRASDVSYDRIGLGYKRFRKPDPRIAARVTAALGDSRTVVNVGAGTGSYEPADRVTLAVEPSEEMAKQRSADAAPCIRAAAECLPLFDQSFDAAMGILTIHHWSDPVAGLRELVRVARRIVLFAYEPTVHKAFWLWQEYFPAAGARRPRPNYLSSRWQKPSAPIESRPFSCPTTARMASGRPTGVAQPPISTPMSGVASRG